VEGGLSKEEPKRRDGETETNKRLCFGSLNSVVCDLFGIWKLDLGI
jgi:hypothetical protein